MVDFDASFLSDIFGENLPVIPQAVLIAGALLIPALFFLTRKRTICAAVAMLAVLLSGFVVGCSILDNSLFGTFMDLFRLDMLKSITFS